MKISMNFSRSIGIALFILGMTALLAATVYSTPIPALIGLGLVFWGVIITYIQPDEYVKKTILDSTSTTLLETLDETLKTLDYKGKATYLPPKYLNDPESIKAYIPKQETNTLPLPEAMQKLEMQPAPKDAQGILITPPGAQLARLLEKEIGTSLLRISLNDLQQRLPQTLIEDMEIVTDCEIRQTDDKIDGRSQENAQSNRNVISAKFTTTAFKDTCKRATQLSTIFSNVGCPLSSVLAIAFAKATGKPTQILNEKISEDGLTSETKYIIIEEPYI
jgi:hypothetical protein